MKEFGDNNSGIRMDFITLARSKLDLEPMESISTQTMAFGQHPLEEEQEWDTHVMSAFDGVTGYELDPDKVRAARTEEVAYYRQMGVYTKVPIE